MTAPAPAGSIDRDTAIRAIRQSLKDRSGKTWSVRGGRGTAWGWITISTPPARSDRYGRMSEEDAAELAELLGLSGAHQQGVSVPDSSDHRREYMNRAAGLPYSVAQAYWD